MSGTRDLRFRIVQAAGRVLHPFIRRVDPRRAPLPGQQELLPQRTIRWDLSRITWIGPEPFWWHQREHLLDAAFAAELQDAEMIGKGVVLDRNGAVVLESTLFDERYLRRSHVEHLILGRRALPAAHFGQVVPLTNYLDGSYYHWTLESIGRLALVEERLRAEPWSLLVEERAPRFVGGTIGFLLGIGAERIVSGPAKRKRMARCLMVSNPHSRPYGVGGVEVYAPEHLRWLQQRGHARIGGVRPERHNIVITRRDQPGRRLVNEEILRQRFPGLDLKFVALERMSIREQVETFAHAGVIIAVHGAGLANLVYATDAAVIELYPTPLQEKNAACFTQITAHHGLPHLVLHFPGVGAAPNWDHTLTAEDLRHMEDFLRKWGRL